MSNTQAKTVLISCTLRSGSNLLCEVISRIGHGLPTEYFQEKSYKNHHTIRDTGYNDLPSAFEKLSTFDTDSEHKDFRGVKWNWSQFHTLLQSTQSESLENILRFFPNPTWIRLSRRDKIAQTASLLVAQQTGVWVSGDPVSPLGDQTYDLEKAWRIFCESNVEEAMWDRYLASCGMQPLTIYYEDLIHKYDETVNAIIQHLNGNSLTSTAVPRLGDLHNKKIDNNLTKIYADFFYNDLLHYRYKQDEVWNAIQLINKKVNERVSSDVFSQFARLQEAAYDSINKLDLRSRLQIEGSHEWVRGSEFLDGEDLRLDQGATATLNVASGRLLILFHSHPWSGVAEISGNDVEKDVDLYSPISATLPIMIHWEKNEDHNIKISASGRKSNLSSGSEIWIQRIWSAYRSG